MRRFAGYVLMVIFVVQFVILTAVAVGMGPPGPWMLIAIIVGIAAEGAIAFAFLRIAQRLVAPPSPIDQGAPRPERLARPLHGPLPDSELADVPEPVTACPDCGYLNVRMPQLRDGVWPGGGELGDRIVCGRCGYQGIAVTFSKREEYGAFLRELASDATPAG